MNESASVLQAQVDLDCPDDNGLPLIPSKRYFKIGEVSELCGVKPHVIRYWEQAFPLLQPMKPHQGQRLFREQDIHTVRYIKWLLYTRGLTIEGAKKHMKTRHTVKLSDGDAVSDGIRIAQAKACLTTLLSELNGVLKQLKSFS